MARKIILLSDGTGNAAAAVWRTNVWRVFESLDLTGPDQVAMYADGVGTSAFKPLAILGGVFGWGLKRNVLDLYKFICRSHKADDDKIFAFGFSRGAFTIRVVLGLANNQGLVCFHNEQDLHQRAKQAYRAYRREKYHSVLGLEQPLRALRDWFVRSPYDKCQNRHIKHIHFVGLWDTVAAYGLPIEEMTRGVSQWIWPLELPDRNLSTKVLRACHAIALDDERTTFHPVLWNERDEHQRKPTEDGFRYTKDERISQVWFAGAHSNVGGGYPDDALAHIPLCWIMQEAQHAGLKFKGPPFADALLRAQSGRDKDGRHYDPRQGLGGYYRYGPRKVFDLCNVRLSKTKDDEVFIPAPKIHESVFQRITLGAPIYAPIGIPSVYEVVTDSGRILPAAANPFEMPQQAVARTQVQEKAWNLVWLRRLIYFATVAVTAYLLLYPLEAVPRSAEYETALRPVSDAIRLIGQFLPAMTSHWVASYASNPGHFLIVAGLLALLVVIGSKLGAEILDGMHTAWTRPASPAFAGGTCPHKQIQWLRTQQWYKTIHWASKRHIIPFLFALSFVWLAITLTSHLVFNFVDAAGTVCKGQGGKDLGRNEVVRVTFATSSLCFATGVKLEQFGRYRITVQPTPLPLGQSGTNVEKPWRDAHIPTSPRGFYTSDLSLGQHLVMLAALPLRRALFRPWFRVIGRIGSTGSDEEFLDPSQNENVVMLQEIIRARRDGELFFYVNDAVLPLPGLMDFFYRNNDGTAEITIQRL